MKLTTIKHFVTLTAIATATLGAFSVNAANFKHVAVAPEEMASQQLAPAPTKGLFSHSTMLPIYADNANHSNGVMTVEHKIFVDGAMDTPMVLLSPDAQNWYFTVTNANGQKIYDELANGSKALSVADIEMAGQTFKGKTLPVSHATAGEWTVKLTRKGSAPSYPSANKSSGLSKDKTIAGYLVYKGDTEFQLYSYLDNNFTIQNNEINLVAYMADTTTDREERQLMTQKEAVPNTIKTAVAQIKSPSGEIISVTLNDDGINGDNIAGDGKYSAKVPTAEIGVYTNQLQVTGTRRDGKAFSRTTTDIYPIAAKSFAFTHQPAQLKRANGTTAIISVPVKSLDNSDNAYLSAEVWGTNAAGEPQSAAWIGGIATVSKAQAGNTDTLALSFDTRWLTRQNLQAPYTLKSVRLQTVDGNVPLAQREQIALKAPQFNLSKDDLNSLNSDQAATEISDDMLMMQAPHQAKQDTLAAATGSKLLLVHGYCSSQAWFANEWSNAAEFKDYHQNISHNTFAQRVMNFGASYNSFGIVAHSQGGAAALEIYAKYTTGLDRATGGRLIQSVGTPYQGTALAGNLAALGDVFGAGCGYNTDLTYNGASNWLATIPTWARNKVNFYTTSFTSNWWSYDYCHLATDLFLDDPEDGTTEKWSGQLSSGVNRGHTTGQCHTGGMRDKAQTRDTSRNATMNANAAR